MSTIRTFFTAAALLSAGGLAQAGTLGLNSAPLGSHSDPAVRFALWDLFTQTQVNPPDGTTYTFNGTADGSSTLTTLSLAQNAPHALGVQGSGLLSGGDVYYSSTSAQSWTLNATASIDIAAMSFQIKTANVNLSVLSQLYVPTLNGTAAGVFLSGQAAGDKINNIDAYVLEYRWNNLDIDAGTPLTLTFAMAGGSSGNFTRKPVDFVALDVTSVPEPGSVVLCGLAALILPMMRRRPQN